MARSSYRKSMCPVVREWLVGSLGTLHFYPG